METGELYEHRLPATDALTACRARNLLALNVARPAVRGLDVLYLPQIDAGHRVGFGAIDQGQYRWSHILE